MIELRANISFDSWHENTREDNLIKYLSNVDSNLVINEKEKIFLCFKEVEKYSTQEKIATKGVTKIGIQAKRYSSAVSNTAVQEIVAGKNMYNLTKLMVITNNKFTNSANELADKNNVILWDRNELKSTIEKNIKEINRIYF